MSPHLTPTRAPALLAFSLLLAALPSSTLAQTLNDTPAGSSAVVFVPSQQRSEAERTFNMILRAVLTVVFILSLVALFFLYRRRQRAVARQNAQMMEMGLPPTNTMRFGPAPMFVQQQQPPQYYYPQPVPQAFQPAGQQDVKSSTYPNDMPDFQPSTGGGATKPPKQ
ncbi:hypothetical protein DFJ77DRAFT_168166 [Powellomyces hirtus]|nr:hypothetical protein DFJ77DRAFT_168166 [Powellomyces hirtus]